MVTIVGENPETKIRKSSSENSFSSSSGPEKRVKRLEYHWVCFERMALITP